MDTPARRKRRDLRTMGLYSLAIAITGLRHDMRLRRGIPYQQRRPALRGESA